MNIAAAGCGRFHPCNKILDFGRDDLIIYARSKRNVQSAEQA
ncbi:MAG: hypothetical protein ACT4OO_09505 [Nitrospiraceae bacterium]